MLTAHGMVPADHPWAICCCKWSCCREDVASVQTRHSCVESDAWAKPRCYVLQHHLNSTAQGWKEQKRMVRRAFRIH
jgi:hypothetical protein